MGHRRADSNYFQLDADRKRNAGNKGPSSRPQDSFSERLSSIAPPTGWTTQSSHRSGGGLQGDFDDEISIDFCCEVLYNKFGFQSGSIDNQREHVLLLLANAKARLQVNTVYGKHVTDLHTKLFSNYMEWCEFLQIRSISYRPSIQDPAFKNPLHMEIMLYFLIWGESANLRHMPECLCYLYHQMISLLNKDDSSQTSQSEGWFLRQVVRPVWKEASNMQRKNSLGKHLEHVKVRNYDDINEYFWKRHCINIDVTRIGFELSKHHGKTYYEHRSIFTLVLNYYRIFQFNMMFLILLTVISFASAISPSGGHFWFEQFGTIGQVVQPYHLFELKIAYLSIVFAHAVMGLIKCLLEVAHGWHLLVSKESSETSSRSFSYGAALTTRLLWNGLFSGLFGLMMYQPIQLQAETPLLEKATVAAAAFLTPGIIVLIAQTFTPHLITPMASKFIREGETCYVGRHMAPPSSFQMNYILFWIILWLLKAFISYFILVRPLMLPSLAIYSMSHLTYGSNVMSFHNMGLIAALWMPVVFIFNYDTQIYFTVFQAILGGIQGVLMKTGELHGIRAITKAFRMAPNFFDTKVVTKLAHKNDAAAVASTEANATSQMMLRFVVIWNEIVNSFREGDLVDDKEAAILQYDIQSSGEVYEPVFLSAGKVEEAMEFAMECVKSGKRDGAFHVFLVQKDCISAIKSFGTACLYVMEALLGSEDVEILQGLREIENIAANRAFIKSFDVSALPQLRLVITELLELVMDLPDPEIGEGAERVHSMAVVRNFVSTVEALMAALNVLTAPSPQISSLFRRCTFCANVNNFRQATRGILSLFRNDGAMGAATRAYLLLSLEKTDAMPRVPEVQRRLGFFLKSLMMEIPQLTAIKEMRSFSVVTPFYSESVLFSMADLNNPLANHPIFKKVEEDGKNITILKYLITIHPEEWENFLERVDVSTAEEAQARHPMEIRLWASYRGQTLARTVQGMMLYEDAIKILHWLEIGSSSDKSAEQKQAQLEDMVRLKFSYICACQVYGKHRAEKKEQAADIDYLLQTYPNLRVAYVDTISLENDAKQYDTVLIKSEGQEITEVYRYELPGDPILGEGKPENQNNALQFTRGEYVQTIDMNQQHYFEECLKMPCLLATATRHPSGKPVSIIGMREHIFTGNASSLSKFKSWQELVFVTLSQRVLANPLYVRMHYGHPDIFDKVLALTRGGVSKASKGINLSEDVFAGFNSTLRGGVVTHVEFMQCGKGRDVALSQISMFEGKLANGAGETCLAREAHRMGQFMDFCRLNSMYYSHTGFYFATWMTIVTTFVYMYSKVYIALSGVAQDMVLGMNQTDIIHQNHFGGFDDRVFTDLKAVLNTQFYIQAGTFLMLPLMMVYFGEGGFVRGMSRFIEMIITAGPAFFVFQVGTTMHYFDNNLLHGGAKYQATGRGFKITRETFVLLYKAYAASHYRKAFELIGLCVVYGMFGNFRVCQLEAPSGDDLFGAKFCNTAQGYGVQTFSIWFISILWLLAPFLFNTDGLDFEKTKVDVAQWAKWMFAEESYKDDDPCNTGGWIGWWKGDLEMFHNSNMIARFTVILRESRHFLLMFYITTLETKNTTYAVFALGAAGATIVALGFVHGFGLAMRSVRPVIRAVIYTGCLVILTIGYFIFMYILFKDTKEHVFTFSMSLFFGYAACLYGINEMARMWSFANSSIANIIMFQQLAFLFDFVFCMTMLVPLMIMSCIPFLNIIQTRMMYNEGFSKVMSASSQYAFSLATLMGLLGGGGCGWLYGLLTTLEGSANFSSYIASYEGILSGNLGDGKVSYLANGGATLGAIVSGFLLYFLGRRLSIVCGGLCTMVGMVCVCAQGDLRKTLLLPGIGALSFSIGIILPSLSTYIYEISNRDMRGKTILLLGTGFIGGMFLHAVFSSSTDRQLGWVWQAFVASVLIAIITPAINIFPESPLWILERKGWEACESCLVILRRKPDVSDELKSIGEEETPDDTSGASSFKFLVGTSLMLVSSLSTGVFYSYLSTKVWAGAVGTSSTLINSLGLQLIGSLLSFFFIDKLDHKSVLFGTLIPVLLFAAVIGFDGNAKFLEKLGNGSIYYSMIVIAMYFFLGLGTSAALWTACIGMFTTKGRAVSTTFLFTLFFALPMIHTYVVTKESTVANEYLFLYALAGSCIVALVMLIGAGTRKNGVICTRREAEAENARERRLRANRQSLRTPNSARNRNRSRVRSRSNADGYQSYQSPGGERRHGREIQRPRQR